MTLPSPRPRVQKTQRVAPAPVARSPRTPTFVLSARRALVRTQLVRLYNWTLWTLLTMVLFAQFFGVVWSSVTTDTHFSFGQSPRLGPFAIPGWNDEPYSDRAVACVKTGQYYRPMQLSQLLKTRSGSALSPLGKKLKLTTNGMDGYRVVARDSFSMDATAFPFYTRQCDTLTRTLDTIFHACDVLGYNVTRDVLRVVHGVNTDDVTVLHSTLPVLIIPYWDYGALSRYVGPGVDGNACVFRGSGMFEVEGDPSATLTATTRAVREAKTETWLGYAGGVWRHG